MRTQKMKNRIIVCFMAMLGLASCSDTDEESSDYTSLDKQAITSGNLIAAFMDGLRDKWSAGDTILLLHDGQTAFAEAQDTGSISGFSNEVESSFADDGFLSCGLYGIFRQREYNRDDSFRPNGRKQRI